MPSRQITLTTQREASPEAESSPRSAEPSPPAQPPVRRASIAVSNTSRAASIRARRRQQEQESMRRARSQTPMSRPEPNGYTHHEHNPNNGNGNGNGNNASNSSMENNPSSPETSGAELNYGNDGRGGMQATLSTNMSRRRNRRDGRDSCWYERLLPEFVLNVTAPLTGYESALDSDIEEEIEMLPYPQQAYELLERQRLRRNGRIRRRLAGILLVAAAASAIIYTRGRITRRLGVHAAVSSVAGKIENGINRIQDKLNGS